MNRTVDKWTVDATRYFKEEFLGIIPDVPSDELSKIWLASISITGKRMSPRTKRTI
jgi:hypothetical protein